MSDPFADSDPAGYAWLIRACKLDVVAPWHQSWIGPTSSRRRVDGPNGVHEQFAPSYRRPDNPAEQLAFALRYDGVDLAVLHGVFAALGPQPVLDLIAQRPSGAFARRAWFFYEWMTGERLPLPDATAGAYVDALPDDAYFVAPVRRSTRHRVCDNLLGTADFGPLVRRTEALARFDDKAWAQRSQALLTSVQPDRLARAVHYLFDKETRSSFAIEHETPDITRAQRFVSLLVESGEIATLSEQRLAGLQRQIVDARFENAAYRQTQIYVGETVSWQEQRVHFAGPRAEDVPALMAGWIDADARMAEGLWSAVPPVVHAAVTGFGFVFIHPFDDGNGRLHRLLIHRTLRRRGFTPQGAVLPVSAIMLERRLEYGRILEAFSAPRLPLTDYLLNEAGEMTVRNDTRPLFRFPDLTPQAEGLVSFVRRTIEEALPRELDFLRSYDAARSAVRDVVDLPGRLLDLLLRLLRQNHGRLSAGKRKKHFAMLTDDEVAAVEAAFTEAVGEC